MEVLGPQKPQKGIVSIFRVSASSADSIGQPGAMTSAIYLVESNSGCLFYVIHRALFNTSGGKIGTI